MKFLVLILCFAVSNCSSVKDTKTETQKTEKVLEGMYTVISVNQKEVTTDKALTLIFNNDTASLSGFAGCNQYGCSYQLGDKHIISFGMIKATRMYCEKTMQTETEMLQALAKVKNYKLQDNVLTLLQGNTILMTAKASK